MSVNSLQMIKASSSRAKVVLHQPTITSRRFLVRASNPPLQVSARAQRLPGNNFNANGFSRLDKMEAEMNRCRKREQEERLRRC